MTNTTFEMQQEIDYNEILGSYRSDPFDYVDIHTSHTGRIRFRVKAGAMVEGQGGEWNHLKGTLLYVLERERNPKPVHSFTNGEICTIRDDLEGYFVEAGEKILTIKHPLKKREVIEAILRKVLFPFKAPERAKYFFPLELQAKMEKHGQRGVSIKPGDEVLTMSLMKRDVPVFYDGEPGIIHSVYFQAGISMDQGEPLLGICAPDRLPLIQKIITRVKAEWD